MAQWVQDLLSKHEFNFPAPLSLPFFSCSLLLVFTACLWGWGNLLSPNKIVLALPFESMLKLFYE